MQDVFDPPDKIYCASALEDEDMKLREDDKKWFSDEITKQVGQAIANAVDEFRPHGIAKAIFLLRQLGPIATIIGVFVALFALTATQFNLANSRLAKEASFETKTEQRLDSIEKILKQIQGDAAKQSLINHASLPLSEFKATLPALNSAIGTAKMQNVKVTNEVINNLQHKLLAVAATSTTAVESTADYWPTTLEFISYRSQVVISDRESLALPSLPNCTDHEPSGMRVKSVTPLPEGGGSITLQNAQYSDCRVTLDSPDENKKLNFILQHRAGRITFTHCLVIYRGGVIDLILEFNNDPRFVRYKDQSGIEHKYGKTTISGPTLEFDNCLLNFSVSGKPTPYGQKLAQSVLAQNLPTIVIPNPATHY